MNMGDEYIAKYLRYIENIVGALTKEQQRQVAEVLEKVYEDGFEDGAQDQD